MVLNNKKILITGGAGFIANTILKKLLDHNNIVAFDNLHRNSLGLSGLQNHHNLTFIRGDILNLDEINQLDTDFTHVIHTAAIAGIDTVLRSPTKTMQVNMIGTYNILEFARKQSKLERFIDFSTSEVFGSMAFQSSETTNTVIGSAGEARWTYAVSKLAGEHLTHAYYNEFNIPTVTLRPFNIYGPGQTGEGAVNNFIRKAIHHQDIEIYGDGNQIRAWCFVDDFVECLMRSLEYKAAIGQSFNVGNARDVITITGLANLVCRVLESKSKIVFKPALSADIELRIPNVQKVKNLLSYEAKTSLEEGILRTAQAFESIHG
jgi:UDP-glucose 4-epimerase